MGRVLSLLYVCLVFVCLFVCTVTDLSAAEKDSGVKLSLFDYYRHRGRCSPILVNFGSRGVTAALLPG